MMYGAWVGLAVSGWLAAITLGVVCLSMRHRVGQLRRRAYRPPRRRPQSRKQTLAAAAYAETVGAIRIHADMGYVGVETRLSEIQRELGRLDLRLGRSEG